MKHRFIIPFWIPLWILVVSSPLGAAVLTEQSGQPQGSSTDQQTSSPISGTSREEEKATDEAFEVVKQRIIQQKISEALEKGEVIEINGVTYGSVEEEDDQLISTEEENKLLLDRGKVDAGEIPIEDSSVKEEEVGESTRRVLVAG